MNTFILGDYHGNSLEPFREHVDTEEIDHLMSTGDFDQVETIQEFLSLKEKVGEDNTDDVGGNHDHAMLNGRRLSSGSIASQIKTYPEMVDELHEDIPRSTEAREYLEEVLQEKTRYVEIGGRPGILVHGGIAGYLQNPEMPEEEKPLWYRLWHEEEFEETFEKMENRNAEILVRGHDHWTEHVQKIDGEIEYNLPDSGDSYTLREGKHIITHGPWEENIYAKITEQNGDLVLEYHEI